MAQLSMSREFLLRVYRKHAVEKVRGVDMEILANKDNLARLCKNVIKEYNLKTVPAQIQRMIKTHKQRRRTEKRRKTTKPKRSPRVDELSGHSQDVQGLERSTSSRTHKRYNSAVDAFRTKPAPTLDNEESPKRHVRTKSLKDRPSRTQSKRKRLEQVPETPPLPVDQGALALDAYSQSERPPEKKKKKKKKKKRNSLQELSTKKRSYSSTPRSSKKKKKKKKRRKSSKRDMSKNRSYSDADAVSPRVRPSLKDDDELPPITFEENAPQENSEKKKKKKKKKSKMPKKSPLSSSSSNLLERQDTGLVGDVLSDQVYPNYESALALVKDSYLQKSSPKSASEETSFDFSRVVEDEHLHAIKDPPDKSRNSGFIGAGLLDCDQLPDYQSALAMVAKSTSYITVTKEEELIDDVKQESDSGVLPSALKSSNSEEEVAGVGDAGGEFDESEVKRWFSLLDVNNNGTLSSDELMKGFQMLGIPLTKEEAQLMAPEQLDYDTFRDIFLVVTSPPAASPEFAKNISHTLTPGIIEKFTKASSLHSSFRKSLIEKKNDSLKITISKVVTPGTALINIGKQENDPAENADVQRVRALSFGGDDTPTDDVPLDDYLAAGVGPASPTVQDISSLVSIASERFSDAEYMGEEDIGGAMMDVADTPRQSAFDSGVEIDTPRMQMIDDRLLMTCTPSKKPEPMLPEKDFIFLWRVLVINSAHEEKVDLNGLITGFKKLEMPLTEEEANEMFQCGCTDGSGLIGFERFKELYGMRESLSLDTGS